MQDFFAPCHQGRTSTITASNWLIGLDIWEMLGQWLMQVPTWSQGTNSDNSGHCPLAGPGFRFGTSDTTRHSARDPSRKNVVNRENPPLHFTVAFTGPDFASVEGMAIDHNCLNVSLFGQYCIPK